MMMSGRRRRIALLALLLAGLTLLFGTGSQSQSQWSKIQSEHFDYFYREDQGTDPLKIACALERLEWFWDMVAPLWDFPPDQRIAYYKHDSREDIKEATGRNTNALAFLNRYTVHSTYYADAHEVAHLLTTQFLFNSSARFHLSLFWLEGLAMYYTWPLIYYCEKDNYLHRSYLGTWQRRSVHCHARCLLETGELFPIDPCIHDNRYFNTLKVQGSYPAAGSFVTFLLGPAHTDPEALERFRAFLSGINNARCGETVREKFLEIYGVTLEDMEASWHQFLREWREEEGYEDYCRCSSLPT